jgi:alcohol dehydrogenase (cytochrome c)
MWAPSGRKSSILGLVTLLLAGVSAFAQQGAEPTRNLTPVTDAMLRDPPASDWLMWRRTYNGWGYSPLAQINKDNVKNLWRQGKRLWPRGWY